MVWFLGHTCRSTVMRAVGKPTPSILRSSVTVASLR
jgi:hypothetical protein